MRFVNVRRAAGLEPLSPLAEELDPSLPPVELDPSLPLVEPVETREPTVDELVGSIRVETTTVRGESA
jgi:hypothetical protein